ncbi:hypothetical protein ACFCYB_11805 [Streptomyces sp. NPDC056309]|uniref:hypothetical protein n=1 Tax=unclassified Streptomyces TaxID=2593676 RepID=UPI0035E2E61C
MHTSIVGASNMGRGVAVHALAGQHAVRIFDTDNGKAGRLTTQLRDQVPGADISPTDDTAISTAG